MELLKKKGDWKRFLLPLAALVVGFCIGVGAGLRIARDNGETLLKETASTGMRSVLPDTVMQRQYRFSLCMHTVTTPIDAKSFIGYTEEELMRFYSPDRVSFLENGTVSVTHNVDGCCPMHYLLRLDETGQLCVYHTDAELFTAELIQQVTFDSKAELGEDDAAHLRIGTLFDTLAEIDAYLESLES